MEKSFELIFRKQFGYRRGIFFIENVAVRNLARRFGTPLYIYSAGYIRDRISELFDAFAPVNPLICYSVKANGNLKVLRIIGKVGCGADVVSGGELAKAIKSGIPASRIVYAGVGKTHEEIISGIRAGIFLFTVESMEELVEINALARKFGRKTACSFRVNLNVDVDTHHYTRTAKAETKFGLPLKDMAALFQKREKFTGIEFAGIQFHLGSQIKESAPYVEALRKLRRFLTSIRFSPRILDIGGGFGIPYMAGEKVESIFSFGEKICSIIKRDFNVEKVILEPGRFIVGNAGILVARIIYSKKTNSRNFLITDAAMNDLIRPSLYSSYHLILPEKFSSGRKCSWDVVGPICETGDFLGKNRKLPRGIKAGDLLVVLGAGAYGFSMSSNYNGRPRAAEVLIDRSKVELARRRETYNDLWDKEV